MKHIRTIINKEWAEVFRSTVLYTTMLLPLVFAILPLIMLKSTAGSIPTWGLSHYRSSGRLPETCQGLSGSDCLQAYLVSEFLFLFMVMPVIIPINIAAYSIVGEKTTRSLEPLLATPITTVELLAGKCFAAVIPAIGATYLSVGIFNLGLRLLNISPGVIAFVNSPVWLLANFVLGPLMALISALFALYISSRVTDPRVAEQISSVVIVPVMGVMLAQMAGIVTLNLLMMLISIVVVAGLAFAMLHLGNAVFERENILTRWK